MDEDLEAKLQRWEQNSPANKQLQALSDLAMIAQELLSDVADSSQDVKQLGVLLMDIREGLGSLNNKEAPEVPDYAKPVVEAVSKLEKALTASIKAIEVKPEFNPDIKVNAPAVNVGSPSIDLKGVEKVLKTDIPKAFEKSIKLIPKTEIPKSDYTPLLEKMSEMLEWLESIDHASRMKPTFPNVVKVTNVDGSSVAGNIGMFTTPYNEILVTYTDSTKATISTVKSKLSGVVQQTITLTQTSTTDDYVVS